MRPAFVDLALQAMELDISKAQRDLLQRYLDLLLDANQRVNLTAVKDRDDAWHRLILDSLTLVPGLQPIEAGGRVVDVGTGGGIPGIPLAIARPDLQFVLIDATGKKVREVEAIVRTLELMNVRAFQVRAEDFGRDQQYRERFDAAVTRAVGSVSEVLEYCLPLVAVGGRALIIKGRTAEEEVDAASDALTKLGAGDVATFDGYPQDAGVESDLVVISVLKESATPKAYPRKPGIPRQSPL